MFWCIVFVVKISMMWSVEKMRRLWRASALLAGAALALAGCSQTGTGNGEEQTTTVDGTEEKVDAEKVRLDAMDPSAYGHVEGLDLEAGTYISVIGKPPEVISGTVCRRGPRRQSLISMSPLATRGRTGCAWCTAAPPRRVMWMSR